MSKKPTPTSWIDPDDAPDLSTPEWRAKFARAPLHEGAKIVRRGRPALDKPKQAVSLRLDADVIAYFKAGGPGWQTRINERLRLLAAPKRPSLPPRPKIRTPTTKAKTLAIAAAKRKLRKGPTKRAAAKRRA